VAILSPSVIKWAAMVTMGMATQGVELREKLWLSLLLMVVALAVVRMASMPRVTEFLANITTGVVAVVAAVVAVMAVVGSGVMWAVMEVERVVVVVVAVAVVVVIMVEVVAAVAPAVAAVAMVAAMVSAGELASQAKALQEEQVGRIQDRSSPVSMGRWRLSMDTSAATDSGFAIFSG
jgi:hypothetical protein